MNGKERSPKSWGGSGGSKAAAVPRTLINKSVVRIIGGKTDERERKVWEKEL